MLTATRNSSPAILRVSASGMERSNGTAEKVRAMGIEAVREAIEQRRAMTSVERQEKQTADAKARARATADRLASR